MSILHIWRAAWSLDERQIDPFFAQDLVQIDARGLPRPRPRPGWVAYLAHCWRCLRKVAPPNTRLRQTDLVFFADSQNQISSLTPIMQALPQEEESALVLLNTQSRNTGPAPRDIYLPLSLSGRVMAMVLALIFLPRLILRLRGFSGLSQHYLGRFLEIYRILPGAVAALRTLRPKLLIVANDHTPACRLLCFLARRMGIKTLYLQHAQVSAAFPALDFDYAFLDGQIALKTYQAIAARSQIPPQQAVTVFLNGEKKTQSPARQNRGNAIGLAFNTIDAVDRAVELVKTIRAARPDPILIRLHPAMDPHWTAQMQSQIADISDVTLSSAKDSPVGAYFDALQFLISGDSSIHVDAQLQNLPSYYAPLHNNPNYQDYYGFLAQGLVPSLPQNLDNLPAEYQPATDALRRYSESFATKWQGREDQLSAQTILALHRKNPEKLSELYTSCTTELGPYWALKTIPSGPK